MRFPTFRWFAALAIAAAPATTFAPRAAIGQDQSPDPAHTTVVSGRVLDADGKPVAGAQVVLVAELWSRSERSIGACYVNNNHFPLTFRVTGPFATDEQGRFRGESPFGPARPGFRLSAYAAAAGQGHATVELAKGLSSQSVEIKLPREHLIRGRIVDTQGQPAAGATVRPIMVSALGTTLQTLVPVGPTPPYASPLLPAVTTDDKGRFVIRGLGNDKVWLEVAHKALATQRLQVEPTPFGGAGDTPFSLVAARVLEGRVTSGKEGKPAAGARVIAFAGDGSAVECQTDNDGRYSLNPFPDDSIYHMVFPADGQPYLSARRDDSFAQARHVESDIALERGVLVRGRVTESPSGKPVAGALVLYRQRVANNPKPRRDFSLFDWCCCHDHCQSTVARSDGVFEIAVPPGPGHLLVFGPTHDYVHVETSAGELEHGHPGRLRYYPNALIALDLKPGTETHDVTTTLRRGVTLRARVQLPNGKPAEKFIALSRSYIPMGFTLWQWASPITSKLECSGGELIVPGCDPEKGGSIWLFDKDNALGTTVNFTGAVAAGPPLTVKLAPCGSAALKVVDSKGKRVAAPQVRIVFTPGKFGTLLGALSGKDGAPLEGDSDFWRTYDAAQPHTDASDAQGWITFPHLIPGALYEIVDFNSSMDQDHGYRILDFRVKPGEKLLLPGLPEPGRLSGRWSIPLSARK
jgi:hypothetical protein